MEAAGDVNGDGFADLVIGMPAATWAPPGAGLAAVYLGSPTGYGVPAGIELWGPPVVPGTNAEGFAAGVAGVGDVNGDGYDDVAVASPFLGVGFAYRDGKFSIYFGGPMGPGPAADQQFLGAFEQGFARAIAGLGDVNADGFDDVAVESGSAIAPLRLDIFHGSPSGLIATTTRIDMARQAVSILPLAVGDVNGDGFDDVLLRSPNLTRPESNEGGLELHLGSSVGLTLVPAWSMEGDRAYALLGAAAARAGDVNADGFDDVVVVSAVRGTPTTSVIDLYRGQPGGLEATPAWTFTREVWQTRLGIEMLAHVIVPGDVNCDGYSDLVVGWPGAPDPATEDGEVSIIAGSASGFESTESCFIRPDGIPDFRSFGRILVSAGDVDGDRLPDFIVGASGRPGSGRSVEGSVWLYLGDCDPTCNAPAAVEGPCTGIALAASTTDPDGDALTIAWQSGCADVVFAPDDRSWSPTVSLANACDTTCELVATVKDGRGGSCVSNVDVRFTDREAPTLSETNDVVGSFWSPNHRMACLPVSAFAPPATDNCSDSITLWLVRCESSQPDDGLGDGNTESDCVVSADGLEVCLRAERSGTDLSGRTYRIFATGTDACGNESLAALAGLAVVPHDLRGGRLP